MSKFKPTKTQKKMGNAFEKFRNKTGIGFTYNHGNKMCGMISLSTACSCNERCKANAKIPGSICSKCYAQQYLKQRDNLETKLRTNGDVLKTEIIGVERWVHIDCRAWKIARIEAFGDAENVKVCINYCNLCKANPKIVFAAWTKNIDLWEAAFASEGKPDNLILIASAMMVNAPIDVRNHRCIDKVFTVYTAEWLIENGKTPYFINCGARNCKKCKKCYTQTEEVEYVNEILKSDVRKVQKYWEAQGWTDLDTEHPHLIVNN